MNEDAELLRHYASEASESAFAELVQRHVNLVYSTAWRLVNGDEHLAEDVTQQAFTELARKARRLTAHPTLEGWLYTTTRRMAQRLARREQRRRARELEANAINQLLGDSESDSDWNQIRPLLEDAMHDLCEKDRLAVLMRFFQNKSFKETGLLLGLKENAARMRVDRALARLHSSLAKRGVSSTETALAVTLTDNAVGAAPPGLAVAVVSAALAGAATGPGLMLTILKRITYSKMKTASALTLALALTVGVVTLVNVWTNKSAPPPDSSAGFEIVPGMNVGPVKIGMTMAEVEKVLGKADASGRYPKLGMVLVYDASSNPQRVSQIMVLDAESETLPGVAGFSAFAGATKEGIGMGSAGTEIVRAYGQPEGSDMVAAGWEGLTYITRGMSVSLKDGGAKLIRIAKPFDPSLTLGKTARREQNPSPAVSTAGFQIVPGTGVGPIKFGMMQPEVERILGKPIQVLAEVIHQYYQDGIVIFYGRSEPRRVRVIDVLGAGKTRTNTIAASGRVYFDFAGSTADGIHIGSSRADVLKTFGSPRMSGGLGQNSAQEELSYPSLHLSVRLEHDKVTRLGLSSTSPKR